MTGEKNRFKTTEKLWDLDDKQLKTPVHDAMVLWLMDEDNLKALLEKHCIKETYDEFTEENYELNKCLNVHLDYESEKTIMSSPTFIAGYADLVVNFSFTKYVSKEECPIDKKWYDKLREIKYVEEMDSLLKEYFEDPSFEPTRHNEDYEFHKCYFDKEGNELYSYELRDKEYITKHRYPATYNHTKGVHIIDLFEVVGDFWMNIQESDFGSSELTWLKYGLKYCREDYGCNCLIEVKPYIDSFGAVLRQINSYKRFYNQRIYVGNHRYDTKFCLFTFDTRFDKQFESQGITVLHPWISKEYMLELYGL